MTGLLYPKMDAKTLTAAQNHMAQAVELARRGLGFVEPNPMVGCVILRDGQVIGQGHHARFGQDHAEVAALSDCSVDPAGGDVYVTLEPCCFVGKTPPCTLALIQAGVKRVFVGEVDPNPKVAGQGLAQLRGAGIQVYTDINLAQAKRLIEPYAKRVKTQLPWIIAKWAQTLDGCIASRTGDSRWISSAASRKQVHHLRARVDAVMVGIGTVLADDPMLTARDVPLRRNAKRVVIDPSLKLPMDCSLVKTCSDDLPVLVGVCENLIQENPDRMKQLAQQGVGFIGLAQARLCGKTPVCSRGSAVPADDRRDACPTRGFPTEPSCSDTDRGFGTDRPLAGLFATLAQAHQATNVLVEGGSILLGSLFRQQLIDQVLVFVCPKLLGDGQAVHAVTALGHTQIQHCLGLQWVGSEQWDQDILLDYRVEMSAS